MSDCRTSHGTWIVTDAEVTSTAWNETRVTLTCAVHGSVTMADIFAHIEANIGRFKVPSTTKAGTP